MGRVIHRNPFEYKVSFEIDELRYMRKLAKSRQGKKDQLLHLVEDKRIIQRDNVETHMIGLLGECALAKLIYGAVDKNAYLNGKPNDFILNGVSIEVKTLQGYLTFKELSDFVSDIAVLVIYEKNNYSSVWVQGWITKHDFAECHFIDNFGYGDRPCVQPALLQPISTLKTYCIITRNLKWLLASIDGSK